MSAPPEPTTEPRPFDWPDGERRIVFDRGLRARAAALLAERDEPFALLCSPRGRDALPPGLADAASELAEVPAGPVAELSAPLVDSLGARRLVAVGGGRVIDTAKAIVAARGEGSVAALPTTLSGAEMTAVHRLPAGHSGAMVRPALVLWDPGALESAPEPTLRASAMNALAHGAEASWVETTNPVATLAGLDGVRLLAAGLETPGLDHDRLALGALLCGYALGATALSFHHVVSQSLVHAIGAPHAETNAVVLPLAIEAMTSRAPRAVAALAEALGAGPGGAADRVRKLAGGTGELGSIAERPDERGAAVEAILGREKALGLIADPPRRAEIEALVDAAIDGPDPPR